MREALAELALQIAELHSQRDAETRRAEAYKQRAEAAEKQRDELREKYEPSGDGEAVKSSAPARRPTAQKRAARKRS